MFEKIKENIKNTYLESFLGGFFLIFGAIVAFTINNLIIVWSCLIISYTLCGISTLRRGQDVIKEKLDLIIKERG